VRIALLVANDDPRKAVDAPRGLPMPLGSTGGLTARALDAAASSAVMKWVEGWAPPRIAVLGGACHVLPPMKREDGAECAAEFVAPPEALPEADPPDPPCATGAPP
jgi:hypothetical protein